MLKKLVLAAFMSGMAVLMPVVNVSAAPLSEQDRQSLQQPHGRLFYLYSKTVNINTQEQIQRAHSLIEQGQDYPLAIAVLNQVIAVDTQDAEAYLLRAIAYTETEKFDDAENDYKNALRLEPDNPTFYNYRGKSFLYWQDYSELKGPKYGWDGLKPNRLAEAERMYKKALAIEPYYLDGIVGLGDVYARMGKWAKEKLTRNPTKAAEFYKQAIAEYNKVLALFPNHNVVLVKKQDAQEEVNAIEQLDQEQKRAREIEDRIR